MERWRDRRRGFVLLLVAAVLFLCSSKFPHLSPRVPSCCPSQTPATITPLGDTKHLLVSAYMDRRVADWDVRIIGIFWRESVQPLYCFYCCRDHWSDATPAKILQHSDHFGFPFATTDVLCRIPPTCKATHVTLSPSSRGGQWANRTLLPIGNQEAKGKREEGFRFNFTVCVSNLFGDYNNVLQATQALEMYRLLGVGRVVIYNTSCGPDLDRLLRMYSREGFVEMVPWPIDLHLTPSKGWRPSVHGGDVHYYGQLATLNECVYRSMERSRYVLLHDLDEIVVPYQHDGLMPLMDMLEQQHPKAEVFLIENHIFPKKHFEPSGRFHLPQWEGVPGINILEHIYREEPDIDRSHPFKMIVKPRAVEQTSVHAVLKNSGQTLHVPPALCHIIHVRVPLQGHLTREQLHPDTRLWDFNRDLVPNVDMALRRAGLLR